MTTRILVGLRGWYRPVRIGNTARELRRYPLLPATVLLLVLVIPAIFGGVIAPHDPLRSELSRRLEAPAWAGGSWERPLGTDRQGRDILSRMIHGARISFMVAVVVVLIAGAVGTVLGLMAGFFRGWSDYLISRLIDVTMAVPAILVALVLVVVFGPSVTVLIAVIAAFLWPQYARLVRGQTLALAGRDFVARAQVAGCSSTRILVRHIFPNIFNSLVVLATLQVGFVIIIESSLSFLGLGVPRPEPSWGSIVADGRDLIIGGAWWVSLFPGLAIVLTVLSVNLLGDWLRDRLDPRLRHI